MILRLSSFLLGTNFADKNFQDNHLKKFVRREVHHHRDDAQQLDWPTDWLADRPIGRPTDRLADRPTDWPTD